jgi:hypothetical protein
MEAIKQYLRLCWFDVNPLILEESTGFLKLNLLFYALVQYFLQTNMTDDPYESFFEIIFEMSLSLIFIGVMLFFDKRQYAYVQVTTAVFFCTNVLSVFFIPVMVWLTVSDEPLSYYLISLLVIWFYALITQIIRLALTIDLLASSALSLFYFIVIYLGAVGLGQMM